MRKLNMENNIDKFLEIQDSLNKDNEQHKEIKDKLYEVGYKKPPVSGQFKKGVSGNPRGRKKKCYLKQLWKRCV